MCLFVIHSRSVGGGVTPFSGLCGEVPHENSYLPQAVGK